MHNLAKLCITLYYLIQQNHQCGSSSVLGYALPCITLYSKTINAVLYNLVQSNA